MDVTRLRFRLTVWLQSWLLWLSGVDKKLATLPEVARLAANVVRVLGCNPSRFTLRGTNVYLVGTGSSRLLIDASDGNSAFMRNLLQVCEAHRVTQISHLLITHSHQDHIGGLLEVTQRFPDVQVWKCLPDGDHKLRVSNADSVKLGVRPLHDGQEFRVDGAVVTTVFTPGHCKDHSCFVLQGESAVLFSGDCILGAGSCVFESLGDLMQSLKRLKACGAKLIYPGHGPVVKDASAKIDEYIEHRQQREDQVLETLKKEKALSTAEIVDRIYNPLPYILKLSARRAIDKHMQKLLSENRVREVTAAGWLQSATYCLR